MKHLKLFNNHNDYSTDIATAELPNVSYCIVQDEVHYNPWVETRIIAKFNVADTSNQTNIVYYSEVDQFSNIEIDGTNVLLTEIYDAYGKYQFTTTGEHIIKYTLVDQTKIDTYAFKDCTQLTEIIIPNNITRIGDDAFQYYKYWNRCF